MERRNSEKEYFDKLWSGDWDGLNIDINNAVTDNDFMKLRALAHGAAAANNPNMLYLIYVLIRVKFKNPGADEITNRDLLVKIVEDSGMYPDMSRMSTTEIVEYWNSRIKGYCMDIIREIIYSAIKMEKDSVLCQKILEDYANSPVNAIRHLMACAVSNPIMFLDDEDERVSKVAHMRTAFEAQYKEMSETERMQNEFLVCALKAKVIKCYDGLVGGYPEGYMCALFESSLFNGNSGYIKFDADVFYNIDDQRLLADHINTLIKEGKIKFANGCRPEFFPNSIDQEKLEKKHS